MYHIRTDKRVDKFLLSHQEIWERFFEKVKIMRINPFDTRIDYKRITWEANKYRLRIGKYRFLYEIIDHQILIYFYEADSRGDIYK